MTYTTKICTSLLGNSQKLDGGAMFGNAPKALWQRWVSVDERNRIDLSCRCLLIQENNKNILFETGIGAFFEPKLKERFGIVESEHILLESLHRIGLTHEDIDIVVLSHLHFDHAGGLLEPFQEGVIPKLLFPNAQFIVSRDAFTRAQSPHLRDRASFIPHLQDQLLASNRLHLVEKERSALLGPDYHFHYSNGHTIGLLCTEIQTRRGPILFGADLIPGCAWVHAPITMGYDRFPERLIDEKTAILHSLVARSGYVFFTHDHHVALAAIIMDERKRFTISQPLNQLNKLDFA
jgi:glyoxylase-like metal-dependent hydrolase (beta-lactamase superfamily II)